LNAPVINSDIDEQINLVKEAYNSAKNMTIELQKLLHHLPQAMILLQLQILKV